MIHLCHRATMLFGIAVALITTLAQASGVNPSDATPVQRVQAQTRFTRGKQFVASKEYDKALAEFRASAEIVASPNTRLLIARTLRDMGRLIEAYAELGRTEVEADELAREDPRYRNAASAAHEERTALGAALGFVTLEIDHADETTKVRVGGEEIARSAWSMPVPVLPGHSEVTVESAGRPVVRKTVALRAGQSATISIDVYTQQVSSASSSPSSETSAPTQDPAPAAPQKSPIHPLVYAGGALGLAGLATFAIAGSLARSTYHTLEASCQNSQCSPDMADEISRGKTQQTVANLGLGIGLAGLAASATFYFLDSEKKPDAESHTALVVSPGYVGIRGRL